MKKFKNKKELFMHVWNTREHVSEISGKPLVYPNHPRWHWQFLHVLSCGAYPSYALNEKNIMLGTDIEHQDQELYKVFSDKKEELRRAYYDDETIKH